MATTGIASPSAFTERSSGEEQLADEGINSGRSSSVTIQSGGPVRSSAALEWFLPGTPMAADPSAPGNRTTRVVTGDLNNDDFPDIAAAQGFRTTGLYLNKGDQSFAPETVLSESKWRVSENKGATSIALGELDLDGNLDLVVPIYGGHYRGRSSQLYRGLGVGIIMSSGANPMFAGIADFSGDGRPDVVVSGNNGAHSGTSSLKPRMEPSRYPTQIRRDRIRSPSTWPTSTRTARREGDDGASGVLGRIEDAAALFGTSRKSLPHQARRPLRRCRPPVHLTVRS